MTLTDAHQAEVNAAAGDVMIPARFPAAVCLIRARIGTGEEKTRGAHLTVKLAFSLTHAHTQHALQTRLGRFHR